MKKIIFIILTIVLIPNSYNESYSKLVDRYVLVN